MMEMRPGYYPTYWSDLTCLARKVLDARAEEWMPEGEPTEAKVNDLAEHLDGAIDDCVHEWLVDQKREKAERDMAAAEAMVPR